MLFRVCIAVLVAVVAGCGQPKAESSSNSAAVSTATFADSFVLVDSLQLESSSQSPLVRISGIAIDANERFIIADASERKVRIYNEKGELLVGIGRNGDGPGEYRDPRFVVPLRNGDLIIGEGTGRIHLYHSDSLIRSVQLANTSFISSLSETPSGLLLASLGDGRLSEVLLFDTLGVMKQRSPVFRGVPAPMKTTDPRWLNVFQLWATSCNGKLYAAATIADSIWSSPADSLGWHAISSRYTNYLEPTLPDASDPEYRAKPFDWIKKYDVIQGIMCDGKRVGFSFVRGVRNYGDPQSFVLQHEGGWRVYENSPPVIAIRSDTLYALLAPNSENHWVGKYVAR